MTTIRPARPSDSAAWLRMRDALWPDHESKWHAGEIEQFFAGQLKMPLAVLVAVEPGGDIVGFAELSIRNCAEWARAQGCVEFGSDALIDNEISAQAHMSLGFVEVERIRCFMKTLS